MDLKINFFLGPVEFSHSLLEELVGYFIIFRFRLCNFL